MSSKVPETVQHMPEFWLPEGYVIPTNQSEFSNVRNLLFAHTTAGLIRAEGGGAFVRFGDHLLWPKHFEAGRARPSFFQSMVKTAAGKYPEFLLFDRVYLSTGFSLTRKGSLDRTEWDDANLSIVLSRALATQFANINTAIEEWDVTRTRAFTSSLVETMEYRNSFEVYHLSFHICQVTFDAELASYGETMRSQNAIARAIAESITQDQLLEAAHTIIWYTSSNIGGRMKLPANELSYVATS